MTAPRSENQDWTAEDEAAWNEAERITDDLIERGFVCGWPDRGEVFATVRACIASGHIGSSRVDLEP